RLKQFLDTASSAFDYVIVDTPPVLAVADAAIIGKYAGTTLMLLKAGEHPMRMIADAVKRLDASGIAVKGAVFNQVGLGGAASYGYSYNYAYQYSYRSR
ncbi:MAG TPA: hypothetical protein VFV27_04900, partial [Nevskiaceae bacterium]|nr:hypothetical protein [Nevskiaceae bacterium]